jgi:taurine transport system substrate-binding protein
MKKKILSMMMAALMIAGLTACGGSESAGDTSEVITVGDTQAEDTENATQSESDGATKSDAEGNGYDLATAELPDKIRIAFFDGSSVGALAEEENTFKELKDAGVDVEILYFESGRDINNAFVSGSVDIGYIGTSPAGLGLGTGIDYEVAGVLSATDDAEGLAVKNASGIQKPEDFVGKTVATTFSTTSHYSLLNYLAYYGVDASEVNIVDIGTSDIYAAWARDDIDAAFVWTPTLTELINDDGKLLVTSGEVGDLGFPVSELVMVNKDFGSTYHDAVSAVMAGLINVNDIKINNHEQAVADLADYLMIDEDYAESELNGSIILTAEDQLSEKYLGTTGSIGNIANVLKSNAEFHYEQGNLTDVPDDAYFQDAVNPSYLEDAVAHLKGKE